MAHPVRVRTSEGWQDITVIGPPGPQGIPGGTLLGAKATRATPFTMQYAAWHFLPWDAEEYDTEPAPGIHDPAFPQRLYCRTAGRYRYSVGCAVTLGGIVWGTTFLAMNVQKNLDTISGAAQQFTSFVPVIGGIGPSIHGGGTVSLNVGDWIVVVLYQNATGTCTLNVSSHFAMERIG